MSDLERQRHEQVSAEQVGANPHTYECWDYSHTITTHTLRNMFLHMIRVFIKINDFNKWDLTIYQYHLIVGSISTWLYKDLWCLDSDAARQVWLLWFNSKLRMASGQSKFASHAYACHFTCKEIYIYIYITY